jgi:HSP20 family molecular chaperone IbpA
MTFLLDFRESFDPFSIFFPKNLYSFSHPTLDMFPYKKIVKDGKLCFVINVLGIDKKDILVDVNSTDTSGVSALTVKGNTKNELLEEDYSINLTIYIKKPKTIEWSVINGLLQIEVEPEKQEKPNVTIISK